MEPKIVGAEVAEQSSPYTLKPGPTAADFDIIISFITARLEPLREKSWGTDMEPALVGLGDITHTIHGAADAMLEAGKRASTQMGHLNVIARRWRDHPDYLEEWARL